MEEREKPLDDPLLSLRRAYTAQDLVRELRSNRLSQRMIADTTGSSDRSVRNWQVGGGIKDEQLDRLGQLRDIVIVLREAGLTPVGVKQWLRSRMRVLEGKRPVELLKDGQFSLVSEAANSYKEGYYV